MKLIFVDQWMCVNGMKMYDIFDGFVFDFQSQQCGSASESLKLRDFGIPIFFCIFQVSSVKIHSDACFQPMMG